MEGKLRDEWGEKKVKNRYYNRIKFGKAGRTSNDSTSQKYGETKCDFIWYVFKALFRVNEKLDGNQPGTGNKIAL